MKSTLTAQFNTYTWLLIHLNYKSFTSWKLFVSFSIFKEKYFITCSQNSSTWMLYKLQTVRNIRSAVVNLRTDCKCQLCKVESDIWIHLWTVPRFYHRGRLRREQPCSVWEDKGWTDARLYLLLLFGRVCCKNKPSRWLKAEAAV